MADHPDALLARLRLETGRLHEEVERAAGVGAERATPQDYRRFVARLAAFVPPLEDRLARGPLGGDPAAELSLRRKGHLLAQDARALGLAPVGICPALPDVSSVGRAWGALYVLEGSTLGGKVLRRHLGGRWPELAAAMRYIDAYGPRTGEMWSRFRSALAGRADGGRFDDEVVAGACDTFGALAVWFPPGAAEVAA